MAIEPYNSLAEKIKELHSRYFYVLTAFCIFDTLKKLKSPRHAGKYKVIENLKILNDFGYFFGVSEEANRRYFFIELAKFFDTDSRTLTINEVLQDIKGNLPKLNKKRFLEYRESINQPVLLELQENYKPPTKKSLFAMQKSIKSIAPIVKRMWTYRSQWLAHDDRQKQPVPITKGEIQRVLSRIEHILNRLSLMIDFSTTVYNHAKKQCEKETKWIIARLIEYKKRRLEDFGKIQAIRRG